MHARPFATLALMLAATVICSADVRLEVRAGGHDREHCPVTLLLPASLQEEGNLQLIRESDQQPIPVQRFGTAAKRRVMWMMEDRLAAGETRRYALSSNNHRNRDRSVRCVDNGAQLQLSVRGAPVLHFHQQAVEAPEGIDPVYRRSGYMHPVMTPQGNVVTGDFEPDHPHQHGIFSAWVNATFRDRPVDFWNQAGGNGGVEFTRLRNRRSGPVFAQFTAQLSHFALTDGHQQPVLEETLLVRVYNSADPFLLEVVSRQKAATKDPLLVNEYHYGGFALRGPSAWLLGNAPQTDTASDPAAEAGFLTSSGRLRSDGNHTRARWVEMHGPLGSQHGGIIALSAPNNFRAPQTVRLHPNKPYFCFAPMVLGTFAISQQEVYASRYRLVVHDGPPNPELAERMWQDMAHPPKVVVLSDDAEPAGTN